MRHHGLVLTVLLLLGSAVHGQSPQGDLQPGLVGTYYTLDAAPAGFPEIDPGRKPTFVRVDKVIDFQPAGEDFYATRIGKNFLARWSGVIRIERAGSYRFFVTADDTARLFIDDKPVADTSSAKSKRETVVNVTLAAGLHPIRIELAQSGGVAACQVDWKPFFGVRESLSESVLFHDKDSTKIEWDKAAWELRAKSDRSSPTPQRPGKYARTDYGNYYTGTVKAPGGVVTPKGLVIKVGNADRQANLCFDPELMRVSVGWVDGWLNMATGRDGLEGQPSIEGTPVFATKNGNPGWAKGADFKDPRPRPFGPIPREWAKYKGLYVHGDKTVLAYTVGESRVLELPGFVGRDGIDALTRTVSMTAGGENTLLAFEKEGAGRVVPFGGTDGVAQTGPAAGNLAVVEKDGECTAAGVVAAPAGSSWEIAGGRAHLKLPAHAERVRFQLMIWTGPKADLPKFAELLKSTPTPADPEAFTKGGPARWTQPVVTKGTLGKEDGAYVMDTLTVPYENPYGSYMRLTGLDFFPDGRAAVSTMDGDVWVVSGIDATLEKLTWKRYATGLFQALGLKIVEGKIYVTGRDQITRLHDLNGDGEADFYESFNNDCHVQVNYHEFALDLQTDPEGNFYYMKGSDLGPGGTIHSGTMLRVSKDGAKLDVVAAGFRAPNGMSVGPNGELTTGDNQGNWTPLCPINWVKPGGFYGHVQKLHPYAQVNSERHEPICWLPMSADNSSGGQVWATSDQWGPLGGKLLHFSYGKCTLFAVLMEDVGGVKQGGVVRFPFKFVSGGMRGRFHPIDGQLYVAGMKGWQSDANMDGCLHRVRYTGKPANTPAELRVVKEGLRITFTDPLDAETAGDVDNYNAEWFNVKRTQGYGSKEFGVTDESKSGREPVEITAAALSPDGKTVTLTVPAIRPVTNVVLTYKIKGADGRAISQEIDHTIHVVPE